MTEQQKQDIQPGDIVFYILREKDKPCEPEREWKAQVLSVYFHYATVRVLEEGYEDEEETIFLKQIVRVEKMGK
jgi:hypothetical protein